MSISENRFIRSKTWTFWTGVVFLFGYWLFGFDGITFSDDVYYLLAGKNFWEGSMEVDSYHFSMRWGAYVPSGLVSLLLGFEPHLISLISLIAYLGSLALVLHLLPGRFNPWVLLIWFSTQVYFLHFLTKVYPDSQLVFWTVLVPFAATYRKSKPFWAALGVISGLFFGFLTKETIVFLAPLPLLLFVWDWKKKELQQGFYFQLLYMGVLLGTAYLAYFWMEFGDPLYRFESIHAGHYISEYSYADKSIWVMLKRLTILPIVNFVERSYWLWFVFAIPGLFKIRKNPQSPGIEFGLAFLSLLIGFWWMTTNFRFYNPIYLNPRHLIILVPILAFLIALGWEEWQDNQKQKRGISVLILLGVGISLIQGDWKMAGFQALALCIIYFFKGKKLVWATGIYLLIPTLFAINYHLKLKDYKSLVKTLSQELLSTDNQSLLLTHNFIDFSKEVLVPENQSAQELLFPIEKLGLLKSNPPDKIRVLIYSYYLHAYPKEQVDVDALEQWLNENYHLDSEEYLGKVHLRNYSKK